jgi:hypothetical protein
VKNLRANPHARARWSGKWHDVIATELAGAAYDQAWSAAVAANSGYAGYTLTRPAPIMRLAPR